MTRKDSEKDSERPHYYSQFWLDVAAGRRVIGASQPEDEAAELEPEPAPPVRRGSRSAVQDDSIDARSASDGNADRIVHPVAEPLATPDEFIEPDAEDIDIDTENADDLDIQDEVIDDSDIPDMDLGPAEEAEEEGEDDELFDEEEEEEEDEEDSGWSARGRKRNKPARPKAPPKKAPRRETRRGGY